MPARKRTHAEATADDSVPAPPSLLTRIRNRWEFAALYSFIYIFGDVLKIDKELDIDMLEEECLQPDPSQKLADLGLLLLKNVSSHRGLTHEIFDEYTRRQYAAKAPDRNLYGNEDEPKHFQDFDIFTRLKVLYQLAVWNFHNPDKIRERMSERDYQQANWRIEHDGEDAEDRKYFVLDDNRLYRLTPAPLPPLPAKTKSKKPARKPPAGRRQSKRQKLLHDEDIEMSDEEQEPEIADQSEHADEAKEEDDFGGQKWECIAITLDEYNTFLASFKGTRDPSEKQLTARIRDKALPAVEAAFEAQARKAASRARELANLERMATAKRSSRISARHEKEKEAVATAQAEKKKQDDLAMAHREEERIRRMEEERESRMMTREQRLKEREMRRILQEEELAKLEKEEADGAEGRVSERHRQAQLQKTKEELDKLEEESEDWDFDCSICGVHGRNLDDGSHSIACEKCGVWQHSKCHGLTPEQAEAEDFICASCSRPKTLKITNNVSPPSMKTEPLPQPQPGASSGKRGRPKGSTKSATPGIKKEPKPKSKPSAASPPLGQFAIPQNGMSGHSQVQGSGSQSQNINGLGQQVYQPSSRPNLAAYGQQANGFQQSHQSSLQAQAASQRPNQPVNPYQYYPQQYQNAQSPPTNAAYNPYANSLSFPRPQQTPQRPSNSPSSTAVPHLNPTAGTTDVRFSPNHATPHQPAQSYSPTSNRPTSAAMSPTKQPSPPHSRPQPLPSLQPSANLESSPAPHFQAASPTKFVPPAASSSPIPPPAAALGQQSPMKPQNPVSPPRFNIQASGQKVAADIVNGNGSTTQPSSSMPSSAPLKQDDTSIPAHEAGNSVSAMTPGKISMPPAPALTPSVNVGTPNLNPPVKKPTPEKQNPPGVVSGANGDVVH